MFYVEILKDYRINHRTYRAGVYKFTPFVPHEYTTEDNRMWYETEKGTVWHPKPHHRSDPVDMEEFFWIKLRAKKVKI